LGHDGQDTRSYEVKALGDAVSEERTPKGAWGITGLLFSFMLINFADKTVVGLAAVPIMRDLDLTPRQFGFLGSSFSFLFAVSGILVGFVANRIATRWVLLVLAFSWNERCGLPDSFPDFGD
jgi:MFS family permease